MLLDTWPKWLVTGAGPPLRNLLTGAASQQGVGYGQDGWFITGGLGR